MRLGGSVVFLKNCKQTAENFLKIEKSVVSQTQGQKTEMHCLRVVAGKNGQF